jgi:hypothetical protein
MTGSVQDGEDVMQAALFEADRKLASVRGSRLNTRATESFDGTSSTADASSLRAANHRLEFSGLLSQTVRKSAKVD